MFFNPRSVILFDYRHIDITGLFNILQRGVHGTNGPMVNTLVIDNLTLCHLTMLVSILVDMEILTWAQRKTIIQTQFVSVVSKVISDGIFNERF